jgi:hypothetical protein
MAGNWKKEQSSRAKAGTKSFSVPVRNMQSAVGAKRLFPLLDLAEIGKKI